MVKVIVEGRGAAIVQRLVSKALRDAGLTADSWTNVSRCEIPTMVRDARKQDADVLVIAMAETK